MAMVALLKYKINGLFTVFYNTHLTNECPVFQRICCEDYVSFIVFNQQYVGSSHFYWIAIGLVQVAFISRITKYKFLKKICNLAKTNLKYGA